MSLFGLKKVYFWLKMSHFLTSTLFTPASLLAQKWLIFCSKMTYFWLKNESFLAQEWVIFDQKRIIFGCNKSFLAQSWVIWAQNSVIKLRIDLSLTQKISHLTKNAHFRSSHFCRNFWVKNDSFLSQKWLILSQDSPDRTYSFWDNDLFLSQKWLIFEPEMTHILPRMTHF